MFVSNMSGAHKKKIKLNGDFNLNFGLGYNAIILITLNMHKQPNKQYKYDMHKLQNHLKICYDNENIK